MEEAADPRSPPVRCVGRAGSGVFLPAELKIFSAGRVIGLFPLRQVTAQSLLAAQAKKRGPFQLCP